MNYTTIICLAVLLVSTEACAQTTSNLNEVAKAQYDNISKEVKTYPYNPTYCLRLLTAACSYEIYINDMLVNYDFISGNATGIIPIPQFILKSGNQKIRLVIYPRAVEDGILAPSLTMDAKFAVEIFHEDYKNHKETSVLKLAIPANISLASAPHYEIAATFEAEVPYSLGGWSDACTLTKENAKNLEAEALATYERFRKAFQEKDVPTIATMIYKREKEIAQAFFLVSGKGTNYDSGWEELQQKVDAIEEMQPIENYELRFFGNGRIVALLKTEGRLRDLPVVYGETNEGRLRFYGLFLYRPKPGAPLEVIR